MSFGIITRGDSGEVIFSSESLSTVRLGSFVATGRSGSFTPPSGSGYNHIWAQVGDLFGDAAAKIDQIGVWVIGNTINWQYFFGSAGSVTIYYGGYTK